MYISQIAISWLWYTKKDTMSNFFLPIIRILCYILTFDPAQKYYSKVIHQKEVTHSNGQ